jgi:nitrate/nitrite-specific signal transduction histidine kinase
MTSSETNSSSQQSDELVQKADVVVRLYETASTAKVNRLRAIQIILWACALALLSAGTWIICHSLFKPLHDLESAAKRLGENDSIRLYRSKVPWKCGRCRRHSMRRQHD